MFTHRVGDRTACAGPGPSPLHSLVDRHRSRETLVVIDNWEHVIDGLRRLRTLRSAVAPAVSSPPVTNCSGFRANWCGASRCWSCLRLSFILGRSVDGRSIGDGRREDARPDDID
jgi:hypothetical protein